MLHRLSLAVLIGLILLMGILFFRIVQPFLIPLFFAVVLAVLFHPFYCWAKRRCFGHGRIAAVLVAIGVILVVILPVTGAITLVGYRLADTGQNVAASLGLSQNVNWQNLVNRWEKYPWLQHMARYARQHLTDQDLASLHAMAANAIATITQTAYERTLALSENVFNFLLGLAIMALALYYFFADGEWMLAEAQRLVYLDLLHEESLLTSFAAICRGVVLGTVFSAVAQGILAGIGFALAGVEQFWLLGFCALLCSFIPFLGTSAVWVGVTLILLIEQHYLAAIFLVSYGVIVVYSSEHLIRIYVIQNQARMHPLIALVSVLGALEVVGLWGIFIGPMTAAFFGALLNVLRKKTSESSPAKKEENEHG
jgi:predicted PurR-regulated permease PerM